MLPEIVLDDEQYKDIIEQARNTIASMYPEWTDFNEHDPGVTLLELFAVMKESQQFFMNQIGYRNREKYLKLLGLERRKKRAARSLAEMKAEQDVSLLSTQKLGAGSLCFETGWQKQLIAGDIRVCLSVKDGEITDRVAGEQLEFGYRLHFLPFGKTPEKGAWFAAGFERPLPAGVPLDLYAKLRHDDNAVRNPLEGDDFIPLAKLSWQYYTADGWKPLRILKDETHDFLFDGFIHFIVDEPMRKTGISGVEAFFIRSVVEEEEYDLTPALSRISINICEIVQRDTLVEHILLSGTDMDPELDTELSVTGSSELYLGIDGRYFPAAEFEKEILAEEGRVRYVVRDDRISGADEYLIINRDLSLLHRRNIGEGTGFPHQEIDLEDLQVEWESFSILAEDMQDGGYRLWQKVEDFSLSSPEDRHYIFDSMRGKILFGDCIHGMAPEGEILLAGYVRTMGRDGNVKAGMVRRFRMEGMEGIQPENICDGFGGRDEESLDDSFLRAGRYVKKSECAVTAEDYEEYAMRTPGLMIESCKVLSQEDLQQFSHTSDEAAVHLVVKPFRWTKESRAGEKYSLNIKKHLERYRMLGSRVMVYFPEYVEIDVHLELKVLPQYFRIEQRVKEKVHEFFERYGGAFGDTIRYNELYGFMDRQEFVVAVRSLGMEAKGGKFRNAPEGDICLAPNALAVLRDIHTTLTIA